MNPNPIAGLVAFLLVSVLLFEDSTGRESSFVKSESEKNSRKPPYLSSNPLQTTDLLTDQTNYVNLGDHVGTVIALGDFTSDRYIDLLVVQDAKRMSSLYVLTWNHHLFSFQSARPSKNTSFLPNFSLDSISGLPSETTIASAAAFDSNADGFLDVVLSLRISERNHIGVILVGDGSGCFCYDQTLSELSPALLIMDTNDDMVMDIFSVSESGKRMFYVNDPPGHFSKKVWNLSPAFNHCVATAPFNSNAYVDINGDCQPDLVVTSSCGMEVWFNSGMHSEKSSRWLHNQDFKKDPHDFTNFTLVNGNPNNVMVLDRSVWAGSSGDGQATFADFNADGSIDIGVPNYRTRELRISYNVRKSQYDGKLCSVDPNWYFKTKIALRDVHISDSALGSTRVQSRIRVGDFNFDGRADILLLDAESGTVNLFTGKTENPKQAWYSGSLKLSNVVDRALFPITGRFRQSAPTTLETLRFERFSTLPTLYRLEDPLAATFLDLDESGRQDILVSQLHGTRLIWNNYENEEDAVYFKTTGMNSAQTNWKSETGRTHGFSPLPGNTFKVSYGGRLGRETQACTQCPQTGVLSLQSCSCLFGITRIANYIEEMAMGGAGGVRTWTGLMPNALAVVWPQRHSSRGAVKWEVSYLSKGQDGQLKRIVFVLCATLVILFFAIVYIHNLEKLEMKSNELEIGYA